MEYFNLHTHQSTNQLNVIELVNQYPLDFDHSVSNYSIGIHPWFIVPENLELEFRVMQNKVLEKGCMAIGECGLDIFSKVSIEIQSEVFEKQLLLAQKYNKPVILHCVGAFQEISAIKKRLKINVPMIFHGFSKKIGLAKQLSRQGFYLSFGKYFLQNPKMENVFNAIPLDRIFLETDVMDEPIENVYNLAVKYREMKLADLQRAIKNNYKTVFKSNQ